jgi:hypothetical protein
MLTVGLAKGAKPRTVDLPVRYWLWSGPGQGVLAVAWYCSITLAGILPRSLTVMP